MLAIRHELLLAGKRECLGTLVVSLFPTIVLRLEKAPLARLQSTSKVIIRLPSQLRLRFPRPFAAQRMIHLPGLVCGLVCLGILCSPGSFVRGQDVQVPTEIGGGNSAGEGDSPQIARWRLPVKVTVSVSGGYDDNPNGETSPHGSAFVGANLGLSYDFGTLRTRASLRTGTGFTYFSSLSSNQYDPNIFLNLTLTHQVSLRMTLDVTVNLTYQAEPNFSNSLTLDRRAGNYFGTTDTVSLLFQWLPRFSTVSTYSIGTTLYDSNAVADTHDHVDQTFTESIRFLYLPVTSLIAEYSLTASLYNADTDRNSYVNAFLLGLDHTFSQKLQGTLKGGIEFRNTNSSSFQSNDGLNPHFEGSLNYALTGKTTLAWNASYGTQQSSVPSSSASLTFRTGLIASHVLTPRLSTNVSCYYARNDNGTVELLPGFFTPYTEDSVDVSLGFNYLINRFLSATVAYDYTDVSSNLPDRSYSRNRFTGGLSIVF